MVIITKMYLFDLFFQPQDQFTQVRFGGGDGPHDLQQIADRTLLVLKLYDKINPETVSKLNLPKPIRGIITMGSIGSAEPINFQRWILKPTNFEEIQLK